MLLPLEWNDAPAHSTRLPPGLRALADDVLRWIKRDERLRKDSPNLWGLDLSRGTGLDNVDLGGLHRFRFDSGYASLAAGLLLAAEGGRPDVRVWATAARDEHGWRDVDGLAAKLTLASEMQAKTVYVRDIDNPTVQGWVATSREFAALPQPLQTRDSSDNPRRELSPYLRHLGLEPEESDSLVVRRNHYLRLDALEQREFYCRKLLRDIAAMCREALGTRRATPPDWLVTIVSGSPELVLLASAILAPKRCLLLHTSHPGPAPSGRELPNELMPWIHAWMSIMCPEVERQQLEFDEKELLQPPFVDRLWSAMGPNRQPDRTVFDLTPGTKLMTLALMDAARCGGSLLYLRNQQLPGRVVDPLSVTPLLWRMTEPSTCHD